MSSLDWSTKSALDDLAKASERISDRMEKTGKKVRELEDSLRAIKSAYDFRYQIEESESALLWVKDRNGGRLMLHYRDAREKGTDSAMSLKPLCEYNHEIRNYCSQFFAAFTKAFCKFLEEKGKGINDYD